MAKTKTEQKVKSENATRNSKVTKAKNRDVINSRMVIEALNHLEVLESRKETDKPGHSLAKIRGYLKKNHNLTMTQNNQEKIKDVMRNEFRLGHIEMTNHGGPLNFRMRFEATIEDKDIVDSDDTDDTEEEDEE